MANPQLEDGYLKLAHDIAKAFSKIRISGEEWQCLWVVINQTYGWHKKEEMIKLDQFVEATGIKKPHIKRALNRLLSKNIIKVTKKGNNRKQVYELNKDYDTWRKLPKKVILPKKVMSVTKKGNNLPPISLYKKDTIIKDSKDIEHPPKITSCPISKIKNLFHEILVPPLSPIIEWTPTHDKWLRKRWSEKPERQSLEWWKDEFFGKHVKESGWLMSNWRPSLGTIIKAEKFANILNGEYRDKRKQKESMVDRYKREKGLKDETP